MKRSEGRILTTHTGKLVRPGSGWPGWTLAPLNPDQVAHEVDVLVDAQLDIGLDVISNGQPSGIGPVDFYQVIEGFELKPVDVSDGESILSPNVMRFALRSWHQFSDFYLDMFERLGFSSEGGKFPPMFANRQVVTGPFKLKTLEPFQRDIEIFKQALKGKDVTEAFYCVIAPAWVEEFIWNEYYASDEDMIVALSAVMAPIFKTVVDAGLILQLDDPAISKQWEHLQRPPMTLKEYEQFIMIRVEALNAALAGIPEEMVRYHVCWGSDPGMHMGDLPLKDFVKMLMKVKAQAYSIEAAKSTHLHEWKVWRDVVKLPDGKILIPGVIDHTTNVVEHPEVIADRIIAYAQVVGRENVIAGTDCGMRGHATANWEKYKNMVKGAELASKQLWG